MLSVKDLHVNIGGKSILNGIELDIKRGEVHAIMGPNGSGKSTFLSTLAGQKNCEVTSGKIIFRNKNLLSLSPDKRAGEGIFMAFQYPVEIPGISNQLFLQTAINSIRKYRKQPPLDRFEFSKFISEKIDLLNMTSDLLSRSVNVGFSGGEKKRNDILQMIALDPCLCILDETDSGVDIDSIKIITKGINNLRNNERSFVIVTHYKRILDYIHPDYVHVLYHGKIIKSDDFSLAEKIEENGYEWIINS